MDNPDRKILARVKKLLALSKDNANEHERARAMEAAHELLRKHNLEMSAIDDCAPENGVREQCVERILEPWMREVYMAAGILYFTSILQQSRYKNGRWIKYPNIVGRPENIAVTAEMAAFFIHSIVGEARKKFSGSRAVRSFCTGAGQMLYIRAKQIRKDMKAKEAAEKRMQEALERNGRATTTALACIEDKRENENEKYIQNMEIKNHTDRRNFDSLDGDAFSQGMSHAYHLDIRPQEGKRIEDKEAGYGG